MLKLWWESELKETEIGEIPKDWEVKPIGEIAEFTRGFSYKGSEKFYEPADYIFITLNNIKEGGGLKEEYSWIRSNRVKENHFLNEDDLIIANTHFGVGGSGEGRLLGTPALVVFPKDFREKKGVFSHHITKVTVKCPYYKKFLYWYLRATQKDSATFLTGTTVRGIDIGNFKKNKLVAIPSDIERTLIPTVLFLFDRLIENKKRQNEILEKTAEAIFEKWFIDFDFPNERGLPYRTCEGEMKESEFGEIPKGWNCRYLTEIADIHFGFPFNSRLFNERKKGTPIIRIRDLSKNYSDTYTDEKCDDEFLVKPGELLVGMDGEFRPYIWKGIPSLLNQRICRIVGKKSIYSTHFLRFLLKEPLEIIEESVAGTTVKHLLKTNIDALKIVVPTDEVLMKYNSLSESINKRIILNQKQIMVLKEILDILLPLLVFGKLRVEEI